MNAEISLRYVAGTKLKHDTTAWEAGKKCQSTLHRQITGLYINDSAGAHFLSLIN